MLDKKEYCIIGVDGFALKLATQLQQNGAKVILVDSDEEKIETLTSIFPYVFKIDSTNISSLESLNIDKFETVIVGIDSMEDSIITVSNLKKLNVQNIIAKAKNDIQKQVLSIIGETNIKIVWPEEIVAELLAFRILNDIDLDLSMEDNGISIIKLPVKNPKLFGIPINRFEIKANFLTNIIMINREDEIIFPVRSNTELLKNDIITIACRNGTLQQVVQLFTSK